MNPLVGLQNPTPMVSGGLMGNVMQQPQSPSLMNMTPGNWSQVAYQMAGSPKQGGLYPSVTPPTALPGTTGGSTSSGGSAVGGTVLGLLGALAKNPSLLNSASSAISGLFGSSAPSISSILGGSTIPASAMTPVGVDAVSELPSASAAIDAGAADAGGSSASGVTGGLLGGAGAAAPAAAAGAIPLAAGAGSVSATAGALGAGAPGVFASGSAGAGSAGGAAAGSLGLAPAAGLAALLPVGLMLGDAWTGKNTQGNTAMKDWMQSTGATWKPNFTNSGGNTFQTQQFASASNPGTMYDKSGKAMTPTQAANAIYQWATQNGVNPGDFHAV